MRIRTASVFCVFLATLSGACLPATAQQSIDEGLASQYFQQAESICAKDNSTLWGIRLCGPMLLVDPSTRSIVANKTDGEGILTKKGNVFVGKLPDKINIANTAMTWAGVKWTMIMWPLPSNERARARLMFHELFHRVQDDLGLPASSPSNGHLDTLEGRIWLQLEWRALAAALSKTGDESRNAIEDALIFRAHRRSLFPNSDATERGLEMNEGLCEYTGARLRGTADEESIAYLGRQLESAEKTPTFARSFAYASGPPYGFLLDRTKTEWRKGLRSTDDFGVLAQKAYSIKVPANIKQEAEKRSSRYQGGPLRTAEIERDAKRKKQLAVYRAKLIDGPLLILSFSPEASYSFDPNNVESLDDIGTVYPTMRVSDAWGILDVTGGALMIHDPKRGSRVQVPAPADRAGGRIEGEGYTLELHDGWTIAPSERKGDFVVSRSR